jgi:glutamate formiminotransferase
VSTNVHDPIAVPLAHVIERVRSLAAARGARPVAAEVIGLVPEASVDGLPDDVPLVGFDPAKHVIERRLRF